MDVLLMYRGGCVILLDYSKCFNVDKYLKLLRKFSKMSAVLLKKLRQLNGSVVNNDTLHGLRLVINRTLALIELKKLVVFE